MIAAEAVASSPAPGLSLEEAVAARRAGRSAEALAALERLARMYPLDADVWLNLGLCYADARRYREAEGAFVQALALAPAYADARVASARIAYFQGDLPKARARLAEVLSGDPTNASALDLLRQVAAAEGDRPPPWRIDASYARSGLTGGLPDWSSSAVAISRRLGDRATGGVTVEHTHRFGVADTFIEGLVSRRWGETGEAHVAPGAALDARYRARRALRAGAATDAYTAGSWRLRLGADLAWARYRVGDVSSLQPFLAAAYGQRSTLTIRSINTLDERGDYRAGYAVRIDQVLAPQVRVSAGWADAPESAEGFTVAVRAVSAGVAFDLDPATTLRLDATHEMRRVYDRDELSVTLTKRY